MSVPAALVDQYQEPGKASIQPVPSEAGSSPESGDKAYFNYRTRGRIFLLALVLGTGEILSVAMSRLVYYRSTYDDMERQRSRFKLGAQARVSAIRRELDAHLQVLRR